MYVLIKVGIHTVCTHIHTYSTAKIKLDICTHVIVESLKRFVEGLVKYM